MVVATKGKGEKQLVLVELLPLLVWPLILSLPLYLTYNDNYKKCFPTAWYNDEPAQFGPNDTPSPLGLSLGILAVVIGQIFTLIYFVSFKFSYYNTSGGSSENPLVPIQKVGAPPYKLFEALKEHLAQPEGFLMLGAYLTLTWMFKLMPSTYYSFSGGIIWVDVLLQLLLQDFIQTFMHLAEHAVSPAFYQISHKPHHRFTNPKFFDAFNGSFFDTFFMILVPLFITSRIIHTNVWSYMAFGSLYANWLTLIHSEYRHLWDPYFRLIGFGTAGDHHVHHKLFRYNYGHLFMYWDRVLGTYISPNEVEHFNKNL